MKYLLRVFLFHSFSLWFVSQILPALRINGGWQVLLFAGFVLSLLMLLIAPILKILFIPINLLTFGLLSWFINVIVLYLLTFFVSGVSVTAWTFPGWTFAGFVLPEIAFSSFVSFILVSLAVSMLVNLLHDISES
ncbi:phage holin family protein [Candidatus Gottesmanbacteria bacterium]|nr:phage holin family protein [Candidatus Gottesmanbacteria bacterium]